MTEPKRQNILLVEDDRVAAELVRHQLDPDETLAHNVTFDVTWVQYLRDAVEQLSDGQFDAVLLDLNLPDCEGLESLQRLFTSDADASIVVLTAMDDTQLALDAAQQGAHSFLNKSSLSPELLVRTLLYAGERRKHRQTRRQLNATEQEMEAASTVQRMLLPKTAPEFPGLDIAGSYWPFDRVGGDYFDYFRMDAHLGLVMADVSGHGLASAMIMAGLRRIVRSCVELHDDLGQILSIANRAVFDDTTPERFVTAFLGRVDVENCHLTYAAAGHASYVVKASGDFTTLDDGNIALGITRDAAMTSARPVVLEPGDVLVLLTDGFYEVHNTNRELWGVDALLDVVQQHRGKTADEIIAACYEAAHAYCDPNPVGDDMAMIAVKVNEQTSAGTR